MTEEWRDIPGYEDMYQASDLGRVRSLDRVDTSGKCRRGQLKRLSVHSSGHYFEVRLHKSDGGRTLLVHSLVASAFFGPALKGVKFVTVPPGLLIIQQPT